ncbi:MAG: NAD(P)-dependent oxidoreductase, partial [Candidatus Symbiothrix sp.]|nr:NAD(P)-dependent oxidoreductase [Candidatus Symbiothrix sp.]
MKKILITGASGFIGSFLVEEALHRGYETWAGIRTTSSKEYLRDERITFISLPFSNPAALKEQIRKHAAQAGKWDYIIHNAGITKCLNQNDFDNVNYLYTRYFI